MTSNWIAIAGITFAMVFLTVGALRVVEITSLRLGKVQTRILILMHLVGTVLFSGAITLASIDVQQRHKTALTICLATGLVILFPLHIYLALKRRLRVRLKQSRH